MSDALWAARQGDALAHTSAMADVLGGVMEIAAGIAIAVALKAAIVAAAEFTVVTGGLGACVLGLVISVSVGVGMQATGTNESIHQFCEAFANDLFAPTICAHISSGSPNVFINGLPAARAAGVVSSNPSGLSDDPAPEGTFLDIVKGFFVELWRPTMASPVEGASPRPLDQVTCERHAPMPVQYIAEGSDRVFINGQPAVRSGDRSTCEATVVSAVHISPNVRIGGNKLVVRTIRSGKTPGVALAVNVLMMLRGGPAKFVSNLPCMLAGSVNAYGVSQVTGALSRAVSGAPHPVHAATGAKVLGGVEDLDFALPGVMSIEWQRFYNSRDDRCDGLFGARWSVPFEVSVCIELHQGGGERLIYTDEQARQIDLGSISPGGAVFSAGEGLAVRRHDDGRLLVESEDGLYRLFELTSPDSCRLRLSQLGDRNDNRIYLDYDAEGRLAQLRDTFDVLRVALTYSQRWSGRVERVERLFPDDPAEVLASYAFDDAGDLIEVSDTCGHVQRRFVYDGARRMVEHQLPTGLRCFYEWGPVAELEWRVIRHWTDEGEEYGFDYDLSSGSTVVTDGLGRRSTRCWNPQHQVTEYTDCLGQVWRFRWNDERQLLGATDPQGGQWHYTYDEAGNLSTTEDPLGRIELTDWLELWSLPRVETDAAGNSWHYRYDARGNCTRQVDPLGHVTQYRYDERGQVAQVIDATGKTRKMRRNGLGQLTEYADCSGYPTRFTYDHRGWLQVVTDALNEQTVYHRDAQGRVVGRRLADGRVEQYQRDGCGLVIGYTDPAGSTTRFTYDRHGRVRKRSDALRRQVESSHDAYGRLQTLSNENGECYRFFWDAGDRLAAQQGLDGGQLRYSYDGLDNPVRVEQLAAVHQDEPAVDSIVYSLERDAIGRLLAKTTADGRTEYRHDDLDRLIGVSFTDSQNRQQRVDFAYDPLSQLLAEHTAAGTLQHRYDELGNLSQTRLPDGRWLNRLHYGSGHLHQINLDSEVISDFERDQLHREVLRTQGQVSTSSQYDRSGRLRSRARRVVAGQYRSPAEGSREYEYDLADNLIGRLDKNSQNERRTLLHYDGTARIMASQENPGGQHEMFAYDAAANLLEGSPSSAGPVQHNRLMVYEDKRFRYDGFGRMIEKRSIRHGTQQFAYDAESRLIEVRNPNGNIVRMTYDPLGRRIGKTEHTRDGYLTGETSFGWDGLRLLQETRSSLISLYVYGDNGHEPLARVDGSGEHQKIRYYHNDLNGAPERLTETDGDPVWLARYKVWGNTREEHRKPHFIEEQNLRFQGQYLDRETGLHYNTFRFYDPDVGRFTTPDPIGLAGGLNLYAYAPNPVGLADPLGLACGPATRQNSSGRWIDAHGKYANQPSVSRLPSLSGRSVGHVQSVLQNSGFVLTNPANPRNQRWKHADGSEVQIHAYGGVKNTRHKEGNNAHAHKSMRKHGDATAIDLANDGKTIVSRYSSAAHIGMKNPMDFSSISGRSHGQ
ncbi:RHS repeat-associated core domain-containing protein [Pseudomonas huanghezhanensis]|uniref:RHS repeat-associated core domain-containing protein n=1 Tax=Pseudomonas huanghezhanensis TaxID=3002903 RepID=UPI0022864B11|nr:RHS repeat-associated core domain-containing protein [Pseudomonas sp. BSw22131]